LHSVSLGIFGCRYGKIVRELRSGETIGGIDCIPDGNS
jgi:hypothetical protein